jgi:hypothetical protein
LRGTGTKPVPRRVVASMRWPIVLFALGLACSRPSASDAAPWLFVSDIHLNPLDRHREPPPRGYDTDFVLFRSALAEMKRVDPDPPVVVIPGDFLGHSFEVRYAKTTIDEIAREFDRTFPDAQFVPALGNEDSGCGDYALGPDSPFLRDMAVAWAPLVNRRGASPDFVKTFSHDGFYTTKLPGTNLRAVVLDDVPFSPRFRAGCGSANADVASEELDDVERAVPPGNPVKTWLLLHIPPGVDAYSTVHLMHHLAVVPFLDTVPRNRLIAILGDRRRNVSLAVAGHTHKFAFRLIGGDAPDPLPILMVPALSPIFGNNPMFLTADVDPGGTIRRVEEHAYDDDRGPDDERLPADRWQMAGGSADLGLRAFTGSDLAALRRRLDGDSDLQAEFARLYDGGAPPEIRSANFRSYACAINELSDTEYRHCLGEHGFLFLTGRGVIVGFVGAAVVLAVLGTAILLFRRRGTRRKLPAEA